MDRPWLTVAERRPPRKAAATKQERLQLRVFGVVGVGQAGSGASVVCGSVGAGLCAAGGPPPRGVLLQLAHFGTTAARAGFGAGAVANRRPAAKGSGSIRQNWPGPSRQSNQAVQSQKGQDPPPSRGTSPSCNRTAHIGIVGGSRQKTDRTGHKTRALLEF
jgi:hypothetical protein